MEKSLHYFTLLAKRWLWLVLLGAILCGGATYLINKAVPPQYQASATLILRVKTATSAYDSFNTSVQAVPTYALLLPSAAVLSPVVAENPGLTLAQLSSMITVKPQSNTPVIILEVKDENPQFAQQLANEIGQSFADFASNQLQATVQLIPAQVPNTPIGLSGLEEAGIGGLVGMCLALALITLFEWRDDRLPSPRAVQELLGAEILAVIPRISKKQSAGKKKEIRMLENSCHGLSIDLDIEQRVSKRLKFLMITSAVPSEGKSLIATKVAYYLAMGGKRVLLVDANRNNPAADYFLPRVKRLNLTGEFIESGVQLAEDQDDQPTDIPNLRVLSAEALSPGSTKSLQSIWMDQLFAYLGKAQIDYVILDAAPLLSGTDAKVLASYAHRIMLVVDPSKTPRKLQALVKRELSRMHATLLGVVINKSRWPSDPVFSQQLTTMRRQQRSVAEFETIPHRSVPLSQSSATLSKNGSGNEGNLPPTSALEHSRG
jgi:capsular exopolysaccharide synthesis family protein